MTNKIIHYCWFGRNPLPPLALKCIESWKKYLPDYEIKEWNEDNFDVNIIPYTRDAYKEKKYAFVSDYARFWILYHYGGVYFDTDVEVVKNLDDILAKGPFMGCESDGSDDTDITVAPGLGISANPGLGIYKELLDLYHNTAFYKEDGSLNQVTIVRYTTDILMKNGLQNIAEIQFVGGIWVYPVEYFCPKDYKTGVLNITKNTRSIHHYDASWHTWKEKVYALLLSFLGRNIATKIKKLAFLIRK